VPSLDVPIPDVPIPDDSIVEGPLHPPTQASAGDVGDVGDTVEAVVVNHDAGESLLECVVSLKAEGVRHVTVVDNESTDGSAETLLRAQPDTRLVRAGANLGYGAGANRGIAGGSSEFVLVSNPDISIHRGAVRSLVDVLGADPTIAIVGPQLLEADGTRYPSARRFPSFVDAAGHAVLADLVPGNRFTRRYRMDDLDAHEVTSVDWVSGACFLGRRSALAELGGFDEAYFMYAEDTDLCWRARRAGWGVAYVPAAVVTHLQGVSTARRPFRMLVAHHRSVLRFAVRTERGWRRVRLAVMCFRQGLLALRRDARPAE
jgi:N-acetylglucosaminyl-diphospho-decaprenol L-rhamnosyltransferase